MLSNHYAFRFCDISPTNSMQPHTKSREKVKLICVITNLLQAHSVSQIKRFIGFLDIKRTFIQIEHGMRH